MVAVSGAREELSDSNLEPPLYCLLIHFKKGIRGDDVSELFVQAGQVYCVHLFSTILLAIRSLAVECGGGIGHYVRVETKISSHTGSRRDTVIGCETGHHNGSDTASSQSLFQVSSNECAVNAFADHWFACSWRHNLLDRMSSRTRAER